MIFTLMFVTFWLGGVLVWWMWTRTRRSADVDRIKARVMGAPEAGKKAARKGPKLIQHEDTAHGKLIQHLLHRLRLNERLRVLIEQAGLKWSAPRTVQGSLALFLAGFSFVWYGAPAYRGAAVLVGLGAAMLPVLHLIRKRKARMHKFEELFPESLEFLARSMRAGHAFSVSLEMIHTEFQEPLAGEFRRVFEEQNLGLPLDTALERLGTRVPLMDVRFFVSAVLLQKRTGGNLAELLDKLASLIRERFKLRGRIRAIAAHGKVTGMALSGIPVVVGLMMLWVNPDYASFFVKDETGRMMLGASIGLQILGYIIIKKIVTIEV
jgi:tight adherence protein B